MLNSHTQLLAELQHAHAAIEALHQVTTAAQVAAARSWLLAQGLIGDLEGDRVRVITEAGGTVPKFKPMYLRFRTWHDDKKD